MITKEIKIIKLNEKEKKEFTKTYPDASVKKTNDFYALVDKNKFIGGIVLEHGFNKIYKQYNLKPQIFISFFYISEKYKGIKLGSKLFKVILSKYDRIGLATENSRKDNKTAIKFYTKIGFKMIHKEKKYNYWYLG